MNVYELIRRKRDREALSREDIESLVAGYTAKSVPDYQMAAWLMAVFCRGMNPDETAALTRAMMNSGRVLDLSGVSGPKIDKHSTGGVGDKVSLILAPLVASCGVAVPMVSGRSLGHTGGTLDKLEAIPGFRTSLSPADFEEQLGKVGVCIIGQSEELCPADKRIYSLRDVTATVDSIPLIAASIMSKKLAEGIDGLVLDVKTGTGAFMSRLADARTLARTMLRIGRKTGKKVTAIITGMWEPLGTTVGNAVEVIETIEALKGSWRIDLEEVTLALAEEMLVLAGRAGGYAQARRLLLRSLNSGKALGKFRELVAAQGGNPKVIDDYTLFPQPAYTQEIKAKATGYVKAIDALQVGLLGNQLGAGRMKLGDKLDHAAGFVFRRTVGDRVEPGDVMVEVLAKSKELAEGVAAQLAGHITLSRSAPRNGGRVLERLTRP